MGLAYFIVLDKEQPDIDTFVNGKAVARHRDAIYAITEVLGLKGIDDLTGFAGLDEEFDVPEEHRETQTPWFTAREGIEWVTAIRQRIEANPKSVQRTRTGDRRSEGVRSPIPKGRRDRRQVALRNGHLIAPRARGSTKSIITAASIGRRYPQASSRTSRPVSTSSGCWVIAAEL